MLWRTRFVLVEGKMHNTVPFRSGNLTPQQIGTDRPAAETPVRMI
jgi:hypothetical protein